MKTWEYKIINVRSENYSMDPRRAEELNRLNVQRQALERDCVLQAEAEAEASLEIATSLRDGSEDLWIELGNTREELGDRQGALAAFDRAVRSAPYYAHTHWQRGNLLLRMGRYDEAFADLRQAAARNREYFPTLINLAWGLTGEARETDVRHDHKRLAGAGHLLDRAQRVGGELRHAVDDDVARRRKPGPFAAARR